MDQLSHIRTVFSIIIGLSIAHLLKGIAKIIEDPGRNKPYTVHLLWVLFTFLLVVDFWWWEFKLINVNSWNFAIYGYIILYVIVYYLVCALLFPEKMTAGISYETYYYSRNGWIFCLMALLFLMDVGDTLIKGPAYYKSLGPEYTVRIVTQTLLCFIAAATKNKKYHLLLVILFLLYNITWIFRKYYVP
jgi:hypothetical protein